MYRLLRLFGFPLFEKVCATRVTIGIRLGFAQFPPLQFPDRAPAKGVGGQPRIPSRRPPSRPFLLKTASWKAWRPSGLRCRPWSTTRPTSSFSRSACLPTCFPSARLWSVASVLSPRPSLPLSLAPVAGGPGAAYVCADGCGDDAVGLVIASFRVHRGLTVRRPWRYGSRISLHAVPSPFSSLPPPSWRRRGDPTRRRTS